MTVGQDPQGNTGGVGARPAPTLLPESRRGGPGHGRWLLRTWILAGVAVLGFSLAALVAAAYFNAAFGLRASLLALACSVIPLLIVIPTFLWLDRFEAEPNRYLLTAFFWGALVAAIISALTNTSAQVLFASVTDPGAALTATAVFVAPPVEETTKGLLVLLIWWLRRREFDGLVDGVVYAGVVAAGFAFTENISYLAMAYTSGGDEALAGIFIARCLLTPFAHPVFTVMTGIGVGVAATATSRAVKVFAPLLGLLLAMLLHGLWNASMSAPGTDLIGIYLLVDLPLFLAFIAFVVWARRREGRIISRFLADYADAGWLTPAEVRTLSSMSGRRSVRSWARQVGGRPGLQAARQLQDTASELALLRQRMFHTAADARALETERQLLDDLSAARARLAVHG